MALIAHTDTANPLVIGPPLPARQPGTKPSTLYSIEVEPSGNGSGEAHHLWLDTGEAVEFASFVFLHDPSAIVARLDDRARDLLLTAIQHIRPAE